LSNVLLLTSAGDEAAEILPSLSLLDHIVRLAPISAEHVPWHAAYGAAESTRARASQTDAGQTDAVLVDARHDLVRARRFLRELDGQANAIPVLAIITEGGWAAVTVDWGVADVILQTAGPGEVEARIRLAIGRAARPEPDQGAEVRSGELVINEATYSARFRGAALDLTFKEFELLKFLAQHPRRVFTRSQLLQEVWGYDYFGGTRTVDVHVRRLRAKLGTENEALIGTVRNVGYKFVPARPPHRPASPGASDAAESRSERAARRDGAEPSRDSREPDRPPAGSGDGARR
jgi:DNA-binding response OmpR family regulator